MRSPRTAQAYGPIKSRSPRTAQTYGPITSRSRSREGAPLIQSYSSGRKQGGGLITPDGSIGPTNRSHCSDYLRTDFLRTDFLQTDHPSSRNRLISQSDPSVGLSSDGLSSDERCLFNFLSSLHVLRWKLLKINTRVYTTQGFYEYNDC